MAKVDYQAPELTLAEIELLVADAVDYNVATAAQLTKIDQAITLAGQAACTWDGIDWWFLWGQSTFDTVDGTALYDLRTVNTNAMVDLQSVRQVWEDTTLMGKYPGGYNQYLLEFEQQTAFTGTPRSYTLFGNVNMVLYPTPDDAYTMTVHYLKRHSKITSAGSTDAALIIPAEYQMDIYVEGAIWLLRHEKVTTASLRDSPYFVEAIQRMLASAPTEYDNTSEEWPVIPDGEHVTVIVNTTL
jgi:hypothetical protein